MEGLGTILGILAILVALAALWFASDISRRVEEQNRRFFETHVKVLKERLEDSLAKLATVDARAVATEKQVAALLAEHQAAVESLGAHKAALEQVERRLDHLDRSIPPKYRAAVASQDANEKT